MCCAAVLLAGGAVSWLTPEAKLAIIQATCAPSRLLCQLPIELRTQHCVRSFVSAQQAPGLAVSGFGYSALLAAHAKMKNDILASVSPQTSILCLTRVTHECGLPTGGSPALGPA